MALRVNGAPLLSEESESCSSIDTGLTSHSVNKQNEMLNVENAGLRDRVAELERRVGEQEDELVCLRSSMADVLRRLNQLEVRPSAGIGRQHANADALARGAPTVGPLPHRSFSKSMGNLRKHLSNVSLAPSMDTTPRRTISPSPRRVGSSTPIENGQTLQVDTRNSSPRRQRPALGNRQSDSIKRWMSTQDFNYTSISSYGSLPRTPASPGPRRFGSSASLASNTNMSVRSLTHVGFGRDPIYYPDEGVLQMYMRGRAVNVLAPGTHTVMDLSTPAQPPKATLNLEWVYGYRGKDCRSNLFFLPTGEMVYFTATVVIMYNPDDQVQRHYMAHTDDVKCLAVHPNRLLIATGQASKQGSVKNKVSIPLSPVALDSLPEENEHSAHVRVWDSVTLQTSSIVGVGEFERSVSCCAFSKVDGGQLLAIVDDSYEHTLSIWDWQRRKKITETKSANEQVFNVEFHPTEKQLLISCGKSHISFWNFDGVVLLKKIGVFDGRDKPKYVLCMCFGENGEVLSGDSNGVLRVWDTNTGRVIKQLAKEHQAAVFSLTQTNDGRILSGGGGKDRRIIEWDQQLNHTGRSVEIPEQAGSVRTITQGRGNMLLIGTTHNCIMQGNLDLGFNYLVQGHMDEVWSLAVHPLQQQFLTAAYDRTLKMWDAISRSLIWTKDCADPVQCVTIHPSGGVLCVGTTVGRWLILDALSRDVLFGQKDGNDIISCVQFSPDGRSLAVASRDGNLYVYTVSECARRYNRLGVCGMHSSGVISVDWSTDGQYLRTNTADHSVLYWDGLSCKCVSESAKVRGLHWSSNLCSLNWCSAGIWPENPDGTEIHATDRSHDQQLLAVAHDCGLVQLYTHPCTQPKSLSRDYSGHSSRVTNVRFVQNDSRLISVGGKDNAVFQWNVNKY